MFKYNNINLKLFSLTLFATVGLHNVNEASARLLIAPSSNSSSSNVYGIKTINEANVDATVINKNISSTSNLEPSKGIEKNKEYLKNAAQDEQTSFLLADRNLGEESTFNLAKFEGFSSSAGGSKTKTIRTVSLYFFLLLFVPFGIFYPFFLFYKKLLNGDKKHGDKKQYDLPQEPVALAEDTESKLPITSLSAESLKLEESTDKIKAVVSKLQIAFAVKDNTLRQKLEELCSSVDSRTDQGIAELMRKTISLLINENESTHACYSSESLSVDQIKTEFEAICAGEKRKLAGEKLSVVGGDDQESKPDKIIVDSSSTGYTVVTLVLCTSHTEPLFTEISTRNQLLEELSELGKMRQDDLIKFDLLWNPQLQDQYLSNNELLMNYIDMMRLF